MQHIKIPLEQIKKSLSHCTRCGTWTRQSADGSLCYGCIRDLSIDIEREKRDGLRPYLCGTCGDTGKIPGEAMIGYGPGDWRWSDEICERCPCCCDCGVELRLHQRGECP